MRTLAKKNFLRDGRLTALTVFLLAAFFIIVLRLAVLQIVSAGYYKALAEDQYSFYKKLTPTRGDIKLADTISPESYTVATNITKHLVWANPKEIIDNGLTTKKLAEILNVEEAEIAEKISDKERKYVVIKRQLTEEEENKINELSLAGIGLEAETVRFYPEKKLLSHALGFVGYSENGTEKQGLYGLERSFEKELAGVPGSVSQEKDATGAWIFGGKRDFKPAQDGTTLLLSVDRSIQSKAQLILEETVSRHSADGGCIIVMNPKTGGILAMATFPDFDPNEYSKVEDPSIFNNTCTTSSYEPGSVFKAFTYAAAIDRGKINPETTYTDTGEYIVDGFTIKNSDNEAHGLQTMTQALEESLNTGVIFAKNQVGDEAFFDYVKKFGFGKKTGVELAEVGGDLKNLQGKIAVNYAAASFGQGFNVTPIQLVQGYSAFANSGRMVKPHIIQTRVLPDGKTSTTEVEQSTQVITSKTATTIGAMLVSVVEKGHGKRAGVPGYYIAGKTGTAQVARKDGKKGYEENNNIGTFIGFGPLEDPKFVALVRINHPRTVQFAESTAAPAFGQMAQFILNYYNVPPTRK